MSSDLENRLGISQATRDKVFEAWSEWGEVLGLEGDALRVFMDLMMEYSTRMDDALPPGFKLEINPNRPPKLHGSVEHAVWEAAPLQEVLFTYEAQPYKDLLEQVYEHGLRQGDLEPGEVVRKTEGATGVWVQAWVWLDDEDVM